MLSPTRGSPGASQNEELLRTAKSLRLRFADDEPINIDASLSRRTNDTKKHKTIEFAPFRASHGNLLPGPKIRDAAIKGYQEYSDLNYTKESSDAFARNAVHQSHAGFNDLDYVRDPTGGFSPYTGGAVNKNTGYFQELARKNAGYNGARIDNAPSHIGGERQHRQERGYPQEYRSPQPQQPYYRSPEPYPPDQRYHIDQRPPNNNQQQSNIARRSRSRSPSPESPVVSELEERYHKLRLALHSKAMNGLEKVEKELTDEVTASINAIFDPVAQLDQKFRQVLLPLSDGETQLSIVSTQDNGEDSQRSHTIQISALVMDFEREAAQVEIELIGKELLAKPPYGEDSGSSKDGRRNKGTIGMKSKLDGLLAEFSEDLECMSSDVVEEMSKYEKLVVVGVALPRRFLGMAAVAVYQGHDESDVLSE
ncbi:hypothetical protein PG993_000640 [Apiospora rasikravindrae]|uniref:Uncharacterized protein n=1 Tax=Apiospora rasikravindrae TaxID=990691 RepID=A0ABR1UBW6_9PEZI